MELIFIFILPLLFICFTSEIQVERNFEYDNNGNYETSQETKNLSFDNSIIRYTKQQTVLKNVLVSTTDLTKAKGQTIYLKLSDLTYTDSRPDGTQNYNWFSYAIWGGGYIIVENNYKLVIRQGLSNSTFYDYTLVEINNETYYSYENVDLTTFLSNMDENNLQYANTYYYYEEQEVQETVNTIWGNIKELLINNLDLNENVLLDIVLCYTILWFIMFLIWHLLYGFLELLFHVIPSRWKEGNLR